MATTVILCPIQARFYGEKIKIISKMFGRRVGRQKNFDFGDSLCILQCNVLLCRFGLACVVLSGAEELWLSRRLAGRRTVSLFVRKEMEARITATSTTAQRILSAGGPNWPSADWLATQRERPSRVSVTWTSTRHVTANERALACAKT